jgi:hypothetical protein
VAVVMEAEPGVHQLGRGATHSRSCGSGPYSQTTRWRIREWNQGRSQKASSACSLWTTCSQVASWLGPLAT